MTSTENAERWRLYDDLAWLWPTFGSVEDYRRETEQICEWMREYVEGEINSVLDLGCGGGKNGFHLSQLGAITGVDLSAPMLAQARELNPAGEFIQGDMRSVDLGRHFDVVFVNDALVYMQTREDVRAVLHNAWRHLRPGGVMVFMVEISSDSFVQQRTRVTHTQPRPGCDVTIVEQDWRRNNDAESFELSFVYMIREGGDLRVESDVHTWGLFPLRFWRGLPSELGFSVYEKILDGDDIAVPAYVCVKPSKS